MEQVALDPGASAVPGSAAVRFADVRKQYGDHIVLDGISFDVPPGQKLVIIGPSGSGKTTILRCLMTLEGIDAGAIQVDGETLISRETAGFDRKRAALVRQRIGMVFQQFNLFPHMTVLDNVTIAPRKALRVSEAESQRTALELLGMVGLDDKVRAYPHQLSGGQQQRVAIARALAMKPHVMLFDEVTSALDPELVGEVLKVIRLLASQRQMTMLIVTHEMQFAAEIADLVMFIDKGRIVEADTPRRIFGQARNERTRQFLRALSDR